MAVNSLDINNKALFEPTHGTIFLADASTEEVALPDDLSQFSLLTKSVDNKWFNIGHTSADNKIETSFDGGDADTKATWLVSNARTSYEAVKLTLTGKSVQGDKNTLMFVYNGWAGVKGKGINVGLDKASQKVSMLVLAQDEGANLKFGMYLPNVELAYDTLPDFSNDNFVEFGFSANVLDSMTLEKSGTGKSAALSLIPPESFAAAATSAPSH